MDAEKLASADPTDRWAEWLLCRRHGGDANHARTVRHALEAIRDKVLDGAQILPGMTLLDVGSGDGLIAFGALQRMENNLAVTLVDSSKAMLVYSTNLAKNLEVQQRCRFVENRAECMLDVLDHSADVLTSRAVLAYVDSKQDAINEFYRVLRPGGRVSIAEPIHRDHAEYLMLFGDALKRLPSFQRSSLGYLIHRYQTLQFPSTPAAIQRNSMTNFSERDLVAMFQVAGFRKIHMEFHIDVNEAIGMSWNAFLDSSPFPGAATQRELFTRHFSFAEVELLEGSLRPVVEAGHGQGRTAITYLTAIKPHEQS